MEFAVTQPNGRACTLAPVRLGVFRGVQVAAEERPTHRYSLGDLRVLASDGMAVME
jgi:hypothetical protein